MTRRAVRATVFVRLGVVAVSVAILAVGLRAVWPGFEARRTVGQFLAAVRHGDCSKAADFTTMVPPLGRCPPTDYGLPAELNGVSAGWDTSAWRGSSDQVAVLLEVPDSSQAWNAHLQRIDGRWMVDSVAATA